MVLTDAQIDLIRESSLTTSRVLAEIAAEIKPGITGNELDAIAHERITAAGGTPSFLGFGGFPKSVCISVNEAVVHGIPDDTPLQPGDVVSIDCGVHLNGFHGDQAYSFLLAGGTDEVRALLEVTRASLLAAIDQAVVGNRVGDIGHAVQQMCEREHGYGVVRELVGHGLGTELHDAPEIPNYGRRGAGSKLTENMCIAIEPMVNLGTRKVVTRPDGWTIATRDGKPSAHFEHDVVVKRGEAIVLTDFGIIDEAVAANDALELIE